MKSLIKTPAKSLLLLAATTVALMGCVEIKSDAKINDEAKVEFNTTYDLSKLLPSLQQMSKDSGDIAKNFSCDKMNEKLTKEFKCKDIAPGKFSVSGEFLGDADKGVIFDKDKKQLTVDAVKLFKTVADLNPSQEGGTMNSSGMLMKRWLVPVSPDQVASYKQMGMVLTLAVTLPGEVKTVDGAQVEDIKDNTVNVNFIDIAGKESYLITSKLSQGSMAWKILFILFAIAFVVAAVMYLFGRSKSTTPAPLSPTPTYTPTNTGKSTGSSLSTTDVASEAKEVKEDLAEGLQSVKKDVSEEVKNTEKEVKDVIGDDINHIQPELDDGKTPKS